MAITIRDDLPEFLVEWLKDRGAVAVVDDETGKPGVVPLGKKRKRKASGEDTYTSADMDVDPAANIQFDPSFLNNIIGSITGLFNTSKGNTELSDIEELSYGSRDKEFTYPNVNELRNIPITIEETFNEPVVSKKSIDQEAAQQLQKDIAREIAGFPIGGGNIPIEALNLLTPATPIETKYTGPFSVLGNRDPNNLPMFKGNTKVYNDVSPGPRGQQSASSDKQERSFFGLGPYKNITSRKLFDLDPVNANAALSPLNPLRSRWEVDELGFTRNSVPAPLPSFGGMFSKDRDFSYGPSLPASVSQAVPSKKPTNLVQDYIETNQAQAKDGWKFNDNTGLDRAGRSFQDRLIRGGTGENFLYDPNLTRGEKMGFGLSKLAPSILGAAGIAGAPLVGLFGAIGQAMGGYHPLNQASNIFMDPFVGTSRWDSPEAGGGGAQTGILNLDNQIEDLAQSDPGRYIETPYGYITAGELNNAIKSGALHFGADEAPHQLPFEDMGFRQDKPFMLQNVGDSNITNQQAVQDLANTNAGAFLNRAAELLPDAGYNEIRDVAEGMSQVAQITDNMSNIYDFDFDYGDIDSSLGGIEDSVDDFGIDGYFGEGDYGDGLI